MSRKRSAARKKGVDFRRPKEEEVQERIISVMDGEDGVPYGDIYLSVVAACGFDPIREAEERRRLS